MGDMGQGWKAGPRGLLKGKDLDPGRWARHRGRGRGSQQETAGEWPGRRGSKISQARAGMKTEVEAGGSLLGP